MDDTVRKKNKTQKENFIVRKKRGCRRKNPMTSLEVRRELGITLLTKK